MISQTLVLYHSDCMDGFGAAWAAWLNLGDSATYIPVQYDQPMPAIPDGSTVRILDFSYLRADMLDLVQRCPDTLVIDHHKTSEEALSGLPFAIFDQKKSGAVLAWEHFHPCVNVPEMLLYIQDRDLWEWKLPDSRAINLALQTENRDFSDWETIRLIWSDHVSKHFAALGRAIQSHNNAIITRLTARPVWLTILCYTVPAVNSPVLQSEIGEALLQRHSHAPFAVVWSILPDGSRLYSLRSRQHDFDVSVLARDFGGGGHQPAAGFTHPCDFPIIKKEGAPTS